MTVIEVVNKELEKFGLSDSDIAYFIEKMGGNPEDTVNIREFVNSKAFELAKAELIKDFILENPESWTQGDMTEKHNFDALKLYVSNVYRKYGKPDPFSDTTKRPIVRRL